MHTKNFYPCSLRALALWLVLPVCASAQSNSISISGRVLDQDLAAISGATVTLHSNNPPAQLTVITDEAGRFRFEGIPATQYRLVTKQAGFSASERIITATSTGNTAIAILLQPAPIAESVVITSSHLLTTPESREKIPGSFGIVDAPFLERSRALTSTEVLRKVAGVNVRDEEGLGLRPNIGMRGMNPTRSTKLLLLEDGIPLTYAPYGDNASYYHPPIDRFESIEVLKGSGQILYGPQTVGGVINYLTPTPPQKQEGSISITSGNHHYFNGHLSYGDTLGNTGFLFGFTRKQGKGSRENTRSGLNDFNFKSVTTFTSQHALTFKFNYYGEESNVGYSGLREDEFRANSRQNPFRNDFFYGRRIGASLSHAYVFNPDVVLTTNLYGSYFRRHWWRQASNSNERPNDAADPFCGGMNNLHTTCGNQGRLRRYLSSGLEPRFRITKRIFNLRSETYLGFRVHVEDQERVQKNGDRPNSRDGVVVENNERGNQAYSAFAQQRFILGNLTVTPGLRIEHVKYQRTNRLLTVNGKTKLTQLVPGLGVSYSTRGKLTLFAGVHRGFAPPRTEDVINNSTGGSIDLDPELSWNYESGLRAKPHPAVSVESTFFRMDYANQIVPASLAGGVGSTFTNGGKTLHQGVEISVAFDTATILRRRYNLYLRSAYTFLPVADFRGIRFSSVPGLTRTSVTGNRLPYAPEQLLNASVGYAHSSGIDAFLEAVYVDSQFSEDLNRIDPITANGQTGLIPSYTIWNATVNYRLERWHTTVFVTAKNLFDRLYVADRARGLLPGPPRGVQAGFKFEF
ncbi:MAG: TonB-dependent receptor plug domain-containing protein [Acidobacteriota bacterium]|nr:TonB-dependent receptor plug domain-containing protein [Acidobacteriota bacterium]